MRARLAAIVLSLLLAAFAALTTAGAVSASTPIHPGSAPAVVSPAVTQSALFNASALPAATSADSGESITGTVKGPVGEGGDNAAIAGVVITVKKDGAEVGTATTDAQGQWTIAVREAGTYEVSIDTSTLPKTVKLQKANGGTIPGIIVQPGATRFAIFPLEAAGAAGAAAADAGQSTQLQYYLAILVAGLRFGLIIAMTAIGLSLVFGTTGLINFAHGEFVAIGAVLAYVFGTAPFKLPFIVAILIAIAGVALLSGLVEWGLWRPLRRRGTGLIQMFIISIGLSLLLRHTILLFFGSSRQQMAQSTIQTPLNFGPLSIAPRDLIIIILSIVILVGVALMLQRTRMGKAMRAVADNKDLAEASGIDVQKVILHVWILGGGLAAVGGVFYGLTAAVYWDMGFNLLLLMFAGIILGGLGSAYGAILGSLVVGIVAQGSTIWFPAELQYAWALLVLIVVLLVRPQGILGRLQRAG
ncbi:MAG: branched-chain amino acid ABC transporter permease [Nakamurella sp.]